MGVKRIITRPGDENNAWPKEKAVNKECGPGNGGDRDGLCCHG